MLCQKCGLKEAIVHKEETVYRQKIEQHLCALCAGNGDWSPPEETGEVTFISHTSHVKRLGRPLPPMEEVAHGLAAVAGYVTRLCAPDTAPGSLMIHTATAPAIIVSRLPKSSLILIPCITGNGPSETSIREFFMRHDVAPFFLQGMLCQYPLPDRPDDATSLIIGVLTLCFNVGEHDPLKFRLRYPRKRRR